jgi:hypothetical protein
MRQQSLFVTRELPAGFVFEPNFLGLQEERDLFALAQTLPFYEFKRHGVTAKRRVIHFGLRYALASRVSVTPRNFQLSSNPFEFALRRSPVFLLSISLRF